MQFHVTAARGDHQQREETDDRGQGGETVPERGEGAGCYSYLGLTQLGGEILAGEGEVPCQSSNLALGCFQLARLGPKLLLHSLPALHAALQLLLQKAYLCAESLHQPH